MSECPHPLLRPRILALFVVLGTILVFFPIRQHGFITYDDAEYLTENRMVQSGLSWPGLKWAFTSFHASLWIPVTWLSHMLDCELFGLDPAAHHLMGLLWHTANALLFFWVFRSITGSTWPALFAACLFAWHPLRVESVAWAAERKDLLSAFFGLLTIRAYHLFTQGQGDPGARPRWWYAVALVFFALGLMSKPMLVTLPFVLLLLDIWPLKRLTLDHGFAATLARLAREKWPFFALAAVISIVTAVAAQPQAVATEQYGLGARAGNALIAYSSYLSKTLFPNDLAIIYPLPSRVPPGKALFSLGLLLSLTWLGWRLRHTRPWWLVGWLWFLGMLIPVSGLVQVGTQAMADRFTYLALMGLTLAMAFEGAYWCRQLRFSPLVPAVTGALLLTACVYGTQRQLGFWQSSETLFRRTLAVTGPNPAAHANLGVALEQQGRTVEAREQYEQALELMPTMAQVHNNLANLLEAKGERNRALYHYEEAVRLRPKALLAHLNLGTARAERGLYDQALQSYAEAARLDPRDPRPHYLAGKAHLREGHSPAAVASLNHALQRDPNDLQSLLLLVRVISAHPDPAIRNGPQALALATRANDLTGGGNPFVLDMLSLALAETGRFPEALQAAKAALQQLGPDPDTNALNQISARIELYSSGQPYRENFGATR